MNNLELNNIMEIMNKENDTQLKKHWFSLSILFIPDSLFMNLLNYYLASKKYHLASIVRWFRGPDRRVTTVKDDQISIILYGQSDPSAATRFGVPECGITPVWSRIGSVQNKVSISLHD